MDSFKIPTAQLADVAEKSGGRQFPKIIYKQDTFYKIALSSRALCCAINPANSN